MSFFRRLLDKTQNPTQEPMASDNGVQAASPPASTRDIIPFIGPGAEKTTLPPAKLDSEGMAMPFDEALRNGTLALVNEPEQAIGYFQEALRIQPDQLIAHLLLADAYILVQRNSDAERECRAVLALAPDNPNAHYGLAVIYWRQKQMDNAIREYQLAIHAKPDFVNARSFLAQAYRLQGRYAEAVREAQAALRYDRNHAQSYNELAEAYVGMKDWAAAAEASRSVLRLDPNRRKVHYTLGFSLVNLGERAEGIRELRKAYEMGFEPALATLRQLGAA